MVIVDLSGKAAPKVVDEGDEPILFALDLRGILVPNGVLRVITPRWSRDGRWIAFLKRGKGTTQVWRAFTDGSGSAPATHSNVGVVDFQIASDGSSIVYATLPGLERQRRDNEKEGLAGWHYDDRFAPWISKWPMAQGPVERKIEVLDGRSGRVRAPMPDEAALISVDHSFIALGGAAPALASKDLEIDATDLTGGAPAGAFHARTAEGSTVTCTAAACQGAMRPWRVPGTAHVGFFRREGWADASTAIYDWDIKTGEVRRLYLTEDVLSSCAPAGQSLICFVDSSLEPRRLVRLDPGTGKRRTLFDPNPQFRQFTLGTAERLHWRNAFGMENVGDLVYPVG
jgi:dipeptidyl aminopeptidase/acylaminoacyl peptidase